MRASLKLSSSLEETLLTVYQQLLIENKKTVSLEDKTSRFVQLQSEN